jgi:hypothetical protein
VISSRIIEAGLSTILFANNELAAAPEQTPTQFQIGPDVEIISLD